MNITISYPQPSKSRIWLPPACYLLTALVIQMLIVVFHNQIIKDSNMNLGRLRDPVVIVLATSLLWMSLRFILRKQHRFLMQFLLQQNKLCELHYFQRKLLNRLRNQLLIVALSSALILFLTSENTMLAPYPDKTSFGIIMFGFLMVSGVFICQCSALPHFLIKQFLPATISSPVELKTCHQVHNIHQLILIHLVLSLSLWPVISAVFPALTAVAVAFSVLTGVIAASLLYQTSAWARRANDYRDAFLKSTSRKLHFLRHKGQYPEQAMQLAIKKLQHQRSDVKASTDGVKASHSPFVLAGASMCSILMWWMAL